ncbi:Uncharacterised protein [Vibrio cholerae]|nr:Uncharacterised protein [Vibrio cholerae]
MHECTDLQSLHGWYGDLLNSPDKPSHSDPC